MSTSAVRCAAGAVVALSVFVGVSSVGAGTGEAVDFVAEVGDPALVLAGSSRDAGEALGASRGLAEPVSLLATAAAVRRAEEALRSLGSAGGLTDEIAALYRVAGVGTTPADIAELRARAAMLSPEDEARLARVVRSIRRAAGMIDDALEGLSPDERQELETLLTTATDALADDHADSKERAEKLLRLEELALRVDLAGIHAAGIVVASTLDSTLEDLVGDACGAGTTVSPFADPAGLVVVGSAANDTYTGPTVLLLEPGGNDSYELGNRAGGVRPGDFPVSVVIDLDGDDSYHSGGKENVLLTYVQGGAGLGIGALVDVCGDDDYASGHLVTAPAPEGGPPRDVAYDLFRSQGHGALGIGILADVEGNDDYASANRLVAGAGFASYHTAYVQGSGHFGIGLLIDALGEDRYSSANVVRADSGTNEENAVGDTVATFSTEFCQGAGLSLGAGVLLEGTDYDLVRGRFPDPDGGAVVAPAVDLSSGSDDYNSANLVTADSSTIGGHGGHTNVYSLICQGASGAPYPATSERVGDPGGGNAGSPPPPEGFGAAVGFLLDATGNDRYNSANRVTSAGTDLGDVKVGKCRSCHVPAAFNVRVNQGASGAAAPPPDWRDFLAFDRPVNEEQPPPAPEPAGQGLIGIAHVGVLIDGIGDDLYNSANGLLADGYDTSVNFSPICAHADYQVIRSQGFGGNEDLLEAITGEGCQPRNPGGGKCDGADGRECPPTLSQACIGPGRAVPLGDVDVGAPVPLALPVLPGCFAGILVDGEGDDGYNSRNELEAKDADSVFTSYVVDVSLGSGLAQGVGVAVGALLEGEGRIVTPLCDNGVACADPRPGTSPLGSADDEYNSHNDARVKRSPTGTGFEIESWSISRSLGSGSGGYGVFADASVLGVGGFAVPSPVGGPIITFPSADVYNSANGCEPFFLFDVANFGFADGGAGAFVEAFGDDVYEQNPCPVTSVFSYGFAADPLVPGVPPSLPDVAVFADLWGGDTYPASVFPPPGPVLGTPAPPDNDGVWTGTGAGLGLGIDLLPALPPVP